MKSVFLLRVSNFVEWPKNEESNINEPLVIGVYGNVQFYPELEAMLKAGPDNWKKIKIKKIKYIDELADVKILFVSSNYKSKWETIIKELKNKPILTISDSKLFVEYGGMISMYIQDKRLALDINLSSIKEHGLYVSAKLLKNAKKVIR